MTDVNPADYDAWYDTPRGRWIGETEYALAARMLKAQPGDSLLDVGCGTGWFTRRAATDGLVATGLDPNPGWLDYARAHSSPALRWVEGDARALPFPDRRFDHVLSIAALCFIDDERQAVAEIVRVARNRFAIGWLNRSSLLYRQKGRDGGSGAYRGARWHTAQRGARAVCRAAGAQFDACIRRFFCLPERDGLPGWSKACLVPCRGAVCSWSAAKRSDAGLPADPTRRHDPESQTRTAFEFEQRFVFADQKIRCNRGSQFQKFLVVRVTAVRQIQVGDGHIRQPGQHPVPRQQAGLCGRIQPEFRVGQHAAQFIQRFLRHAATCPPGFERAQNGKGSCIGKMQQVENDVGVEYQAREEVRVDWHAHS